MILFYLPPLCRLTLVSRFNMQRRSMRDLLEGRESLVESGFQVCLSRADDLSSEIARAN